MAKIKKQQAEVVSGKFYELLEAMIEAGNTAKWEEHSSNFDPSNKESVEDAAKYYGDLVNKANEKLEQFKQKIKEVFPD
jgi:ABC-type enterochelin transport system substrate-binding protein